MILFPMYEDFTPNWKVLPAKINLRLCVYSLYRSIHLLAIVKLLCKQFSICVDPDGVNCIEMKCIPSDKSSNLSPELPIVQ